MKKPLIPFLNQQMRLIGLPLLAVGATVMIALTGSILAANPTPTPTPIPVVVPKLRATVDSRPDRAAAAIGSAFDLRSPSHPANLIQGVVTDRIITRLRDIQGGGATAGAGGKEVKETKNVAPPEGPKWSAFGEYSYQSSEDHRQIATDSITHSATGGFDVTINKTLAGLIYSWSHSGGQSEFLNSHTTSDSNFVSIYAAQALTSFLSVGVSGGYGHTEVDTSIRDPFFPTFYVDARTNTYTVSPFASLSYAHDNFYGSLTTTYQYLHTGSNCSDQLTFTAVAGYQFAQWFAAEVSGKFTQTLHNSQRGVPEDDDWFGVGPKFKEYITPRLYLYEAYQANLNNSFTQHTVTGGVSFSF